MLCPQQLYAELLARREADPSVSWTARLMQSGVTGISKKISEEATEMALAALQLETASRAPDTAAEDIEQLKAHTTNEAADLLYHYLVLLAYLDIPPQAIHAVLAARSGTSGVEEKLARKHK